LKIKIKLRLRPTFGHSLDCLPLFDAASVPAFDSALTLRLHA
jgi:hypothetical protein